MGEQRFKVGDWVRRVEPSDWPEQYGVVDGIYKVLKVGRYGIAVTVGAGEADATSFEPWQPRVGERVKVNYGHGWNGEGIVDEVRGPVSILKMKTGKNTGCRGGFHVKDLEPVPTATAAATSEQPATLKIEEGKFYKTRDGRRVGPMAQWALEAEHPWEQQGGSNVFTKGGDIWRDDGTSEYDAPPLIAEWIDDPVAKPSNDNAKPKFKVGDLVVVICNKTNGGDPIEAYVIGDVYPITSIIKDLNGNDAVLLNNHYQYLKQGQFAPESTPTTSIVALIENGQPKPSSTPHVHTSADAAEKEAKRLAAKYKGQQFGVFTLTATHEEAAPVYDHKWQNMAALGLKIDAIKELRAVAGLDLLSAKRAVEAFEQAA